MFRKSSVNFFTRYQAQCWLALAAAILLFGALSAKGIWTQEYRWQQVCLHMLATHDYWHPYLDGRPYYDKPLLTYWFIIALAKLNHEHLTYTLLRLPSAIAAGLTLWSTYHLAKSFFDEKIALLSGWLLLTTFYFVFWARVASADMWNVAGIMLSLCWFYVGTSSRVFFYHFFFFLLLAFSALLKGLIAPVLVVLILLPTLCTQKRYRNFLNGPSFLAMLMALGVYLAPFLISSHMQTGYTENGLVEVFRENILRFFSPFDHQGAWYTYFIFFPVYVLPWGWVIGILFIAKNAAACPRDSTFNVGFRFFFWAIFIIFLFLSLSGSRRSYYILPIVPFTMIALSAWWQVHYSDSLRAQKWMRIGVGGMYGLLCGYFLIGEPMYYQARLVFAF